MGQSTILRQLSSGKPGNTHPGSGLCKMSNDELVASFCAKGGKPPGSLSIPPVEDSYL